MTDLATQVAQEVVDPQTGEIINRADVPAVARLYHKIRDFEQQFRTVKRWANDAIIDHMDTRAEWTIHTAGMKLSAPSPEAADITWDLEILAELEEHLPSDRYAELVRQTVVYEPQTMKLQQAAKAGGPVGDIIKRAESRRAKNRYLKVSS